jgi:hypothetical protein
VARNEVNAITSVGELAAGVYEDPPAGHVQLRQRPGARRAQPVYDRAVNPPPAGGREEVDEHMARHIEAGWKLAFYSTNATATGTVTPFHLAGPDI